MERTAFLARVRAKLDAGDAARAAAGELPAAPDLPTTLPATPATGDGEVSPARFLAELASVHGTGAVTSARGLRAAVAAAAAEIAADLGDDGNRRAVLADDLGERLAAVEAGLADAGWQTTRPASADEWRAEAARAALGVTSAALGVCSTGSLVLSPGPGTPRGASLLPTAHLAVLPADRLVGSFEDATAALAETATTASASVVATGPSRTSDIEMTTVYGAHGPRLLTVLIVTSSAGRSRGAKQGGAARA